MMIRGSLLNDNDKRHVLAAYVHRYTGEHKPGWVKGDSTPVQFKDDAEWLEETFFEVTKHAKLDARFKYCESHPTWPENPELRR
jgi:hypothetical protein